MHHLPGNDVDTAELRERRGIDQVGSPVPVRRDRFVGSHDPQSEGTPRTGEVPELPATVCASLLWTAALSFRAGR